MLEKEEYSWRPIVMRNFVPNLQKLTYGPELLFIY